MGAVTSYMMNGAMPEKLTVSAMETPEGLQSFRKSMSEFGFTVFSLDDEFEVALTNYLEATKNFFNLPPEEKSKLSGGENELMKKNQGYLIVDGVKEYLKLRKDDPKGQEPAKSFEKEFDVCWDQFIKLVGQYVLSLCMI
eukprot:TRINITY_DN1045_c0_g1_i1.p1 TRINITY_DN1045_c0_g1~~TRINITY_DN1045_c0_g1_i1.p1  ORF type:complete len:140 (-),score=24.74 TRINITY_DN1045_c0_g1_i1:552-971(-)